MYSFLISPSVFMLHVPPHLCMFNMDICILCNGITYDDKYDNLLIIDGSSSQGCMFGIDFAHSVCILSKFQSVKCETVKPIFLIGRGQDGIVFYTCYEFPFHPKLCSGVHKQDCMDMNLGRPYLNYLQVNFVFTSGFLPHSYNFSLYLSANVSAITSSCLCFYHLEDQLI